MSYDKTGPWASSQSGPHSPYSAVVPDVNFFLNRGVLAENLVLGVPFYGYDFENNGNYKSYATIVNQNEGAEMLDQIGELYYNGIPTIERKTRYAMENIGGIMIWEISTDAAGDKSLLDAIYSTSASVLSVQNSAEESGITYNNPLRDKLRLTSSKRIDLVNFYDIRGVLVMSSSEEVINVEDLSSGIYIIEALSKSGSERFKVIKE